MIDEARDRELEIVMNSMGSALGQITGQFSRDYKRLTDAMQAIVSKNQ